jgi:hypothetical protein
MRLGWSGNVRAVGVCAAIAVGASLGALAPAAMAAPSNDDFANRTQLGDALPLHVTESNVGATREAGEHINGFGKGRSIWWEWEAPVSGWITASVCGSEVQSYVNIFEGTELTHLTSLTEGRGNGDEGPRCWASQSTYTFHVTAGHEYVIGADGNGFYIPPVPPEEPFIPTGEGTIMLSLEATPPPPNDAFAAPIRVGEHFEHVNQSPFEEPNDDEYVIEQTPGYTWGATKEAGEPDHGGDPGGASVWYSWTPTRSGKAWISLQGAGGPKLLALYRGSKLDDLVPLGSSAGPFSSFYASVSAGTEYRIAVDGSPLENPVEPFSGTFMGSFNLSVQLESPPLPAGPTEPGPPSACACVGEGPSPSPPATKTSLLPPVKLGAHGVDPTGRSATFRFSSPIGTATFTCELDDKAPRNCSSPFKVRGLKPGRHVFRVFAMVGGTPGADPGTVHFRIPAAQRRRHQAG